MLMMLEIGYFMGKRKKKSIMCVAHERKITSGISTSQLEKLLSSVCYVAYF